MNMNMKMQKQQSGFTLIELVIVLVILGILAAVAIPRFVDLSDEAEAAALEGVAGNMASAMGINFAGCAANNDDPASDDCEIIGNCGQVGRIMQGGIPDGYSLGDGDMDNTAGATAVCTVTQDSTGEELTFQGIAAGFNS